MKELILLVIGVLIIAYILDKKPPLPTKEGIEIIRDVRYSNHVINEEYTKHVEKLIKILKELNPLKHPVVWTYIEVQDENKGIQLLNKKYSIPVYFERCIEKLKENSPNLVVLTPYNINIYLPDFPIKMDHNSRIPLRKRIDLIFSFILYEYGGICVSPGTIIYKTEPLVNKLFNHDIITVGSSPRLINNIDYSREPNTYILASKPRTPFISEYKRLLLMTVMNNDLYRLINQESYDILKKVLKENKVNQYHFGPKYDGTYNNNHRLLDISDYLGNEKINFLEPKKLFAVSVPYDILYLRENYHWYLRLSEYQFNRSKLEINRLLKLVSFT